MQIRHVLHQVFLTQWVLYLAQTITLEDRLLTDDVNICRMHYKALHWFTYVGARKPI